MIRWIAKGRPVRRPGEPLGDSKEKQIDEIISVIRARCEIQGFHARLAPCEQRKEKFQKLSELSERLYKVERPVEALSAAVDGALRHAPAEGLLSEEWTARQANSRG